MSSRKAGRRLRSEATKSREAGAQGAVVASKFSINREGLLRPGCVFRIDYLLFSRDSQ